MRAFSLALVALYALSGCAGPSVRDRTTQELDVMWRNVSAEGKTEDVCNGWLITEDPVLRAIHNTILEEKGFTPDDSSIRDFLDEKCY